MSQLQIKNRWNYNISEVHTKLYIARAKYVTDETLQEHDVGLIIWAVPEIKKNYTMNVHTIDVDVSDNDDENIYSYFSTVVEEYKKMNGATKSTFVVCRAGISRSATLASACLIGNQQMSLESALVSLRSKRPLARPNIGFFEQLAAYEYNVFGKSSIYPEFPKLKLTRKDIESLPEEIRFQYNFDAH